MPRKKDDKKTFKGALTRLEEIVKQVESGEAELEDSLRLYKEGIELASFCGESLNAMEKEITVLGRSADGVFKRQPYKDSEYHAAE